MTHLELRREITFFSLKIAMPLGRHICGGRIPHLPNDIGFDDVRHFKAPASQIKCKVSQKHALHLSEMHCDLILIRVQFVLRWMFIFLKYTKQWSVNS